MTDLLSIAKQQSNQEGKQEVNPLSESKQHINQEVNPQASEIVNTPAVIVENYKPAVLAENNKFLLFIGDCECPVDLYSHMNRFIKFVVFDMKLYSYSIQELLLDENIKGMWLKSSDDANYYLSKQLACNRDAFTLVCTYRYTKRQSFISDLSNDLDYLCKINRLLNFDNTQFTYDDVLTHIIAVSKKIGSAVPILSQILGCGSCALIPKNEQP